MGLSIQGLRVFLCILEYGSFSAAGRELGMTQPAVSNHLRALEERFGVVLLVRGRPLRATPAGVALADHARSVLAEISALEEDMAGHVGPHGSLVVGASSTPGELLMPGLVTEFSSRFPDVALELRVYDTERAISDLIDREIEVAVVGREVDDPRLSGTVVGGDVLVPVVAASDALAGAEVEPAKLAGRQFVFRERGSATRRAVEEGLAMAGVNPLVAMELGSNAAVARAVAAGAGIGVVPVHSAEAVGNVRPLKVRGLALSRPFVLAIERGRRLSPAAEAFVATCTRKERVIYRLSALCLLLVGAMVLAGCGGAASGDEPLRVGLIPNENPEEVEAQYQPLEDYLKEEIGRRVELSVPTTYNSVVEAMVSGKLDLAYFGGLTYVQARERANIHPLFTEVNPRTGTTKYHSVIIAPANSDIRQVEDIEGKTFAFGCVSSTSGSLYPAIMLDAAGIDYRTDLEEKVYTNGHDATALAFANGQVAAGGLEDRILYDMEEEGIVKESKIRVIKKSAPIEGYPWVVRDALPDKDEQALTDAFLSIEDPELLDLLRAEDYEKVKPSDYDYVEKQARRLDLIAEEQ